MPSAVLPLLAWFFQVIASLCWVASVFVYGGYETGDILQLVAASSWFVSNVLALPDALPKKQQNIVPKSSSSSSSKNGEQEQV